MIWRDVKQNEGKTTNLLLQSMMNQIVSSIIASTTRVF